MMQAKRTSARTLILAAGTAGFVALGAGIAGAEGVASPVSELTPGVGHLLTTNVGPVAESALVDGVAPTVRSVAPEGVGTVANSALSELQQSAHDPAKPAPDLSAPVPRSERIDTPLGGVGNPAPALADTVAGAQDATGLDGNPHDTFGHSAGEALRSTGEESGAAVEEAAVDTGSSLEGTANRVLPHTVGATQALRDEVELPQASDAAQLPRSTDLPAPSDLSDLTGENTLSLSDAVDAPDPLGVLSPGAPTEPQSAAVPARPGAPGGPTLPNFWDLAYAFGLETPKQAQDLVESTELTDDNYVDLGEGEVLGMVGNRNLAGGPVVPQSAPERPGMSDLTGAVLSGDAFADGTEPLALAGPLADTEVPTLADAGLEGAGLPTVAEGADTETAGDLVSELSRGTGVLEDLDTSDLVSVEGGTAEQAPAEDDGLTHHPTFTDLPGSEALPAVR